MIFSHHRLLIVFQMSCIVLQLGQCGNQVGQRLFDTLIEDNLLHANPTKTSIANQSTLYDYIRTSLDRFFIQSEQKLTARALAIDTELKVIEQLMNENSQTKRHWKYEKKCVTEGQLKEKSSTISIEFDLGRLGSGNNWACGYRNGSLAEENILNSLRWQLEHADRVDTILPILSLAGGTGSGLGAYIVECVRDELPRSFLLTTVVVPYTSGEVVVQNYNSLLTLSHLYHSADALLVFENDILQQYAKKLVSHSGLDRPTNIHDMNNILTRHLCSFLQPISKESSSICELNYLLESLLPHSFYKLLTLRCVPQLSDQALDFSTYKWSSLIKSLSQMYICNSYLDEGLNWSLKPAQTRTKSLANVFLARSYDKDEIENDLKQYFNHSSFYSSFVSPSNAFSVFNYREKSYLNYEKYLSFVSNCQTPVSSFDRIVTKSWQLFGQKAYLHHYFKYDIDEQAFLNGFVQIEQVIKSYNKL
uniref:Tubulin delta chain n=1 Tax=Philodina roseola TaxID=96448 RepID=B6S365_PHIRO|nr:tubulin-like protein [Philodina roseola]